MNAVAPQHEGCVDQRHQVRGGPILLTAAHCHAFLIPDSVSSIVYMRVLMQADTCLSSPLLWYDIYEYLVYLGKIILFLHQPLPLWSIRSHTKTMQSVLGCILFILLLICLFPTRVMSIYAAAALSLDTFWKATRHRAERTWQSLRRDSSRIISDIISMEVRRGMEDAAQSPNYSLRESAGLILEVVQHIQVCDYPFFLLLLLPGPAAY